MKFFNTLDRKKFLLTAMTLALAFALLAPGPVVAAENASSTSAESSALNYNENNESTSTSTVQTSDNGTTTTQTSNTTSITSGNDSSYTLTATTPVTIKVLIYSGYGAAASCVSGLKTCMATANANNIISGVTFSYSTSTVINSAVLSGYDVLVMPGGTSGKAYLSTSSISGTAIKNFVASGKGYVGICAGAYAACAKVVGYYNGWGIAPHVYARAVSYETVGGLPIQITSDGQDLFGYSGLEYLSHYNGPAMYRYGGDMVTFATYADSKTGYKGYAAIVGDYYGKGRTVLSGPHPELAPQHPDIVAQMICWAANVSADTVPSTDITIAQLNTAAASVKAYVEVNKRLPNYVEISGQQVSMAQFLQLLATGVIEVSSGLTAPIGLKTVDAPLNPSETLNSGNIQKSEFITIAGKITSYIDSNSRAPNYISSSLGNISFESLVYMYSRIMSFYATNNRLPTYVSMKPWATVIQT